MNRAQRTLAQIAHIQEHAVIFHNTITNKDIAEYFYDHSDRWDLYQRVCDDINVQPRGELVHPDPER